MKMISARARECRIAICDLQTRTGWTNAELAGKLEVSLSTFCRYKRNPLEMPLKVFFKLRDLCWVHEVDYEYEA